LKNEYFLTVKNSQRCKYLVEVIQPNVDFRRAADPKNMQISVFNFYQRSMNHMTISLSSDQEKVYFNLMNSFEYESGQEDLLNDVVNKDDPSFKIVKLGGLALIFKI
jgi:hypothetical protein